MSAAEGELGSVSEALANARQLLRTDPALAREQAHEILSAAPTEAEAHFVLGLANASLGQHREAVAALQQAVSLNGASSGAWRALGDQLSLLEDTSAAQVAYANAVSARNPHLMNAARALVEGKLAIAERLLRAYLHENPTDVAAIRMLAEAGARLGRFEDSEKLLVRCLELAPSFLAARHNYALVLHRQSKATEALTQIDMLLAADPRNPSYRFLRASALTRVGEYEAAIALYEDLLREHPTNARAWLSLGHARKTAGHQQESIDAYLRSAEHAPQFGEAYWSLANMKTYRFGDTSVAAMQRQLERRDISEEDRFHLHYALGKAFEDRGEYKHSFEHYSQGAALRRQGLAYDADETTKTTDEHIAFFTKGRLNALANQGAAAADPIFIVGLPRSGSTLIEQILSSHSAVEGTMELPDILMLAKRIGGGRVRGATYPEALATMGAADLQALGEEYLSATRVQRKSGAPFFVDKMPNNFQHLGLIHLILPNAKIIDARRHPMGCCFSAFKQHFARGQSFSYDLTDLGRYYSDYVRLMAHFDTALPGRVHRVHYEQMIADPEAEVRKLLAYCGLPFEQACLDFHENKRAVRTASSEQVRQPIYADAVEHWRNYEPWLAPLKTALGPVLANYPSV